MNCRLRSISFNFICTTRLAVALGLAATLLIAPAHAKDSKKPEGPVFFPPAPDEPRIQFLTSFSTDEQLTEVWGKRSFFRFIVGSDRVMRPLVKPYGVACSPGKIYICDSNAAAVAIADLAKKKMSFFSPTGEGSLPFPVNIAVDADGTRYVADTKRGQVVVFKEDDYLGAIGKRDANKTGVSADKSDEMKLNGITGKAEGMNPDAASGKRFETRADGAIGKTVETNPDALKENRDSLKPCGIAIFKNRIYVTDLQNHCVRVYNKADRKELFTIPRQTSDKANQLFQPTNVAIDPKGRVRISDTGGFCVKVFDADGKYLSTIGSHGLESGTFARPKGIAADRESRTYVVDAATQVVQLFDEQGRALMHFGDATMMTGGQMALPAGIAIDYDNLKYFQSFAAPNFTLEYLVYVTNQLGDFKVSVFGFGHKK